MSAIGIRRRNHASATGHPPASGKLLGTVPFIGEHGDAVGRVTGAGLGGRLALDLSKLTPETLIVPNEQFFIRTRYPGRLDRDAPWRIELNGFSGRRKSLSLSDLEPVTQPMGVHLLECSGNSSWRRFGLLSAAEWSGAPLTRVLEQAGLPPRAKRVLISGFDKHARKSRNSAAGASWIFTLDQLDAAGAFLATAMNGVALPKDHGYPVRLIMPGWYGCTCIKWVNEIAVVDRAAAATSQMKEFAGRTHQDGEPRRARDYKPAGMDLAAMPVRIEKWRVDGRLSYRVVGIIWGGEKTTDDLRIRFEGDRPVPVEDYDHNTNKTWSLWSHTWRPRKPGRYRISMKVADSGIRTRRLDDGFYLRTVEIDDV